MSFLFVIVIVFSFGAIALIDAGFEQSGTEQLLYVTDSNTEYASYLYGTGWPNPEYRPYDKQTAFYVGSEGFTPMYQYNRTPVYAGNNSWYSSINGTTSSNGGRFNVYIDLPNLENWIVTKVKLNMTLNGDADLKLIAQFGHHNDPMPYLPSQLTTKIKDTTAIGGTTSYKETIPVSLTDALESQQAALQTTNADFRFQIGETIGDGFSSWACQWSVEIYGTNIASFDMEAVVGWSLIGISLGIFVMGTFMRDDVDVGEDKIDNPVAKRPRGRPKGSKTKTKRRS